jgi:hypothetical protein
MVPDKVEVQPSHLDRRSFHAEHAVLAYMDFPKAH